MLHFSDGLTAIILRRHRYPLNHKEIWRSKIKNNSTVVCETPSYSFQKRPISRVLHSYFSQRRDSNSLRRRARRKKKKTRNMASRPIVPQQARGIFYISKIKIFNFLDFCNLLLFYFICVLFCVYLFVSSQPLWFWALFMFDSNLLNSKEILDDSFC